MERAERAETWTVAGVAIVLAALAAFGLAQEVPRFWDPCMEWGQGGGGAGSGSLAMSPDDACPSRSGTSETRTSAAARLLLVSGAALLAAALAAWGALGRRNGLLLAAGFVMAAESVLLSLGLSIAFGFPVSAAALFLAVGSGRMRGTAPGAPPDHGWVRGLRLTALAVSVAAVAAVAGYSASGCAYSVVEAGGVGQPEQNARCSPEITWSVLLLLLPVLLAAAGLAFRVPRVAWAGSGSFAAVALLLVHGMAFLLPFAAALLACVAGWRILGRRPAPLA